MQNENQPSTRKDDLGSKARELGRDLKTQASGLAGSATETVKSQAANLTEQARDLASEASEKVGEKMKAAVSDQKGAGADYLSNIADTVRRVSYEFDGQLPQAGDYIRQAAAQMTNVSDAIRTRDVSELFGDVQDFARKQPAAFFGAAVLAGFAAVRFFKSAPERHEYGSHGSSAYGSQGSSAYGSQGSSAYGSQGSRNYGSGMGNAGTPRPTTSTSSTSSTTPNTGGPTAPTGLRP